MSSITPITDSEVRELADEWYAKLTDKAPVDEFIPLLSETDLKMEFPDDKRVLGWEGFKIWYQRARNSFFDQIHTLKELKVTPSGDKAQVDVIVHWEASSWEPPQAKSERTVLDAYQTWIVTRSPSSQKVVIENYCVYKFE
ncbi:MAG: hypothetical protein AB4057_18570 [Crocosphaera sp.]